MKKLRRFIFCFLLSCQAAAGVFPFFKLNPKPPICVQEENPCKDVEEVD